MPTSTASLADTLMAELGRVIAGQQENLRLVLATLLSGGHVLLEDQPGVGKTVLARSLGTVLGLDMARIQGTSDLLPSDITGVHVFQPNTGDWVFRAGPIFAPLVLVDELNRATAKAQSALLEAMAERQVTVEGRTMQLPQPFMVIATQNPRGDSGTHRLGRAQVDRFASRVSFGLPGRDAERAILNGEVGEDTVVRQVLRGDQLLALIATVHDVAVAAPLIDYALDVVDALRGLNGGTWLSVRVGQTLVATARGLAYMANRDFVTPEDIQRSAEAVVGHRVDASTTADLITTVIHTVPVPVHGI